MADNADEFDSNMNTWMSTWKWSASVNTWRWSELEEGDTAWVIYRLLTPEASERAHSGRYFIKGRIMSFILAEENEKMVEPILTTVGGDDSVYLPVLGSKAPDFKAIYTIAGLLAVACFLVLKKPNRM